MKTERELINYIKQCPTMVKIKGDRQTITLEVEGVVVKFPVINHIYTRFICSLSDAEILSKGSLEVLSLEGLKELAQAAVNRPSSSYDLMFQ
ncbi:MAG TPA: hypothetical protein DCY20_01890 [Firmicutes bacterium]|nr:hypothetical protein [Bacillota bacterium]